MLGARPVLESGLDRRIEGVEPVERQRLGRTEALPGTRLARTLSPARPGVGPVVGEHAVEQLEPSIGGEIGRRRADELGADREMAEHAALLAEPELGAIGELARAADVVEDRGRHQQVRVEPRVQRAGLEHQRGDRHRVLEQATEVGVMSAAGGRGAAKVGRQRPREHHPVDHRAQVGVVDLVAPGARESPPAPRRIDRRRAGTRSRHSFLVRACARPRARRRARRGSAPRGPGSRPRRRPRSAARSGRRRGRRVRPPWRCGRAAAVRGSSSRCARCSAPSTSTRSGPRSAALGAAPRARDGSGRRPLPRVDLAHGGGHNRRPPQAHPDRLEGWTH